MKTAENEKYLILNTENKYYLYTFYIFDKITGEVITANKTEMENFIKNPKNKIEKNIGLLSIEKEVI